MNIYNIRNQAFIFKKTPNRIHNYTCSILNTNKDKLFTSKPGYHDKVTDVFNQLFSYLNRKQLNDWTFNSYTELEARFNEVWIRASVTSSKVGREIEWLVLIHDCKELGE